MLLKRILPILLIALLAFFGGTARFRPADSAASAPVVIAEPSPSVETASLEPAETPEPTPTPTPEPEYFSLSFVGDCTLASVPGYQGSSTGYDTVVGDDYAYPFALTAELFADDDFTMANLECCLTDSSTPTAKTFTFKAPAEYANIMTEGNVNFVTLANNHILDYGDEGCADTKAALDAVGVGYAGRDEYTVFETESGLKIGVYAVSFGTVQQIKDGIAAVKALEPDFIIAALHWGDEGSYAVNSDQTEQGHAAIDAGADMVYGSHPHTLQPIEEYKGHYIYYSMGNWSFGGNTNPRDKDTFYLRLKLMRGADGAVTITERELVPCASSGVVNGNNYQPLPYEEGTEEYSRVLSKLDGTFNGSNLSIGYQYSANE